MTIQFDEGKPSPEEVAHSGVKGMRWGVRKIVGGPSGAPLTRKKSKPKSAVDDLEPTSGDIHAARNKVRSSENSIRSQRKTVAKTGKGAGKLAKMEMDHLKNPDRATAVKMTDGEKLINTLFYGPGNTLLKSAGGEIQSHLIKREIKNAGGKA